MLVGTEMTFSCMFKRERGDWELGAFQLFLSSPHLSVRGRQGIMPGSIELAWRTPERAGSGDFYS